MTEANLVKPLKPLKNDTVDSFLGDLERELSVTPSPDFGARVRVRVERETSRAWSPSRWFFGAFALASAAGVLIMFWNRPESTLVQPAVAVVASHQPAATALPTPQSAAALLVTSATPAVSRPLRRPARVRASVRATSQGPVSADLVSGDPMTVDPTIRTLEVLVPPDQEIAIRRLLLALRGGGLGQSMPGPSLPTTEKLPEASPIEILPIRIQTLPVPGNGGGRR